MLWQRIHLFLLLLLSICVVRELDIVAACATDGTGCALFLLLPDLAAGAGLLLLLTSPLQA